MTSHHVIEREIEQQHVHARLAEDAEEPAFDALFDERTDPCCIEAARSRYARHLQQRIRGRNVRIETGAGGRHGIGSQACHPEPSFGCAQDDSALCGDAIAELA